MGTYDELEIDGIVWQTKALGKGLQTYRPGDSVEVHGAAGGEDPGDIEGFTYDDQPARYLVQIQAVEYALVEDGKLVGLASQADRDELTLDTFDYHGIDEHDAVTHDGPFDPERPRRAMTPKRRTLRNPEQEKP